MIPFYLHSSQLERRSHYFPMHFPYANLMTHWEGRAFPLKYSWKLVGKSCASFPFFCFSWWNCDFSSVQAGKIKACIVIYQSVKLGKRTRLNKYFRGVFTIQKGELKQELYLICGLLLFFFSSLFFFQLVE